DGGSQSHILVVPSAPTTYTALYTTNTAPITHYYHAPPVVLTWEGVSYATGYEVQIDDDPGFGSPLNTSPLLPSSAVSYTAPTLPDGQYYWRVHAKKSDGTFGTYSATQSFVLSTTP